jgi:uncharacterized membrane protein YeaQ/YmgE (transglycosylase-associated protein family)
MFLLAVIVAIVGAAVAESVLTRFAQDSAAVAFASTTSRP